MFKVKNEGQRATVYIYGTIGDDWWSPEDANRAKDFARTLDELSPKPLDIRIDSAGGDVYEGFAIAGAIQRYEGETHAYVDGLAASAASYIALMADRVTMNDYSMLMVHNAWCVLAGNRDDLRDAADRLEALDATSAGIISARSALDLEQAKEAMSAETWYSGEAALEAGVCDEVIETGERMAACVDRAIAGHFARIPDNVGISDGAGEPLPEIAPGQGEPAADARGGSPDGGASHAPSNLHGNEAKDADGAILLGNRVYRKENHGDQ